MIGGFVRGLSMRDVESLCEEAGLGRTSKSTIATICAELHEGSYVKFLLGGRVARGHRSPSRMRLRGSLRSALTGHP